jgi:uncharacterized membrane protein YqiK
MARVAEFSAANISRLVLTVIIVLGILLGLGVWMFYSPGHAPVIDQPPQKIAPTK